MNLKSWLPELALRTLRVVVIGLVMLNSWSVYKALASLENPLVPKKLGYAQAFPHYFFIAFYVAIIFIIWKFLKGDVASKHWWAPVCLVFFFEFFKFYTYGFLTWMNPFL